VLVVVARMIFFSAGAEKPEIVQNPTIITANATV
jgi:hypothetical protein